MRFNSVDIMTNPLEGGTDPRLARSMDLVPRSSLIERQNSNRRDVHDHALQRSLAP